MSRLDIVILCLSSVRENFMSHQVKGFLRRSPSLTLTLIFTGLFKGYAAFYSIALAIELQGLYCL